MAQLGKVPPAVDLISVDLYTCRGCAYPLTDSEASVAQEFFAANLWPRMAFDTF